MRPEVESRSNVYAIFYLLTDSHGVTTFRQAYIKRDTFPGLAVSWCENSLSLEAVSLSFPFHRFQVIQDEVLSVFPLLVRQRLLRRFLKRQPHQWKGNKV